MNNISKGTKKAIGFADVYLVIIAITESIYPRKRLPESPIKIFALGRLNGKKPKQLPANAAATAGYEPIPKREIKITLDAAKKPTPAEIPSITSIILKAFVTPTIQIIDKIILRYSGKIIISNLIPDHTVNIAIRDWNKSFKYLE